MGIQVAEGGIDPNRCACCARCARTRCTKGGEKKEGGGLPTRPTCKQAPERLLQREPSPSVVSRASWARLHLPTMRSSSTDPIKRHGIGACGRRIGQHARGAWVAPVKLTTEECVGEGDPAPWTCAARTRKMGLRGQVASNGSVRREAHVARRGATGCQRGRAT